MSNDSLYRSEFLRKAQNLRHIGQIEDSTHIHAVNPLCGDEQEIYLKITDGKVKEAKFQPKGCLVSKVSTDLLIDHLVGVPADKIDQLSLNDIERWLGTPLTPSRRKCASLGLASIQEGLKSDQ